jgi:hypothetical protein
MKIRFIAVLLATSILYSASSTRVHQPVVAATSPAPAPKKVDYVREISSCISKIQMLSNISLVGIGTNAGAAGAAAAAAASPAKGINLILQQLQP